MKTKSKEYYRNKADKLLQDYIKARYEYCWVCDSKTHCGHHFFAKKNSNALRYYLPNLIPLCKRCHCLVHTQPHLVEPKICFFMGKEWYQDLEEVKRQGVKVNKKWYLARMQELEKLLDNP